MANTSNTATGPSPVQAAATKAVAALTACTFTGVQVTQAKAAIAALAPLVSGTFTAVQANASLAASRTLFNSLGLGWRPPVGPLQANGIAARAAVRVGRKALIAATASPNVKTAYVAASVTPVYRNRGNTKGATVSPPTGPTPNK